MGLAASQARFLAITARKMNCEFESMQIAQDKLSVTRDLQKVSEEYQNSLNATKLVWDTADNDVYNLSYAAMMTPSTINEYNAYMLTDSTGKIVLSESMFKAALDAGIINENGDPTGVAARTEGAVDSKTDGTRNAFLYQLGVQHQVAAGTIAGIQGLGASGYNDKTGLGAEPLSKGLANVMITNAFISYLQTDAFNLGGLYTALNGDTTYKESLVRNDEVGFTITNNGTILSADQVKTLTLGDLLSGQYVLTKFASNVGAGASDTDSATTALNQIDALLGGTATAAACKELCVDDPSEEALNTAYNNVSHDISSTESPTGHRVVTKAIQNAINAAANSFKVQVGDTDGNHVASVSLTNMLLAYITEFVIGVDGYDTGLKVDAKPADSTFFTANIDYNFIVNDSSNVTDTDVLNADFYNQIYNNICTYGCSTDEMMQQKVTDEEYLNYALKNGQLFIHSLNTDGYFYSDHYTLNGHVAEVQDDDAIARAEAEYNIKKGKLDYKEQTLELKMKNIDTELSALTTEYDTVKNLISKNVEKVFTMFST